MFISWFLPVIFCIFALQEIVSNPQLFVDGASRFDVQQGELGELHFYIFHKFWMNEFSWVAFIT